jgi:hypothetical protein
MARCASAGSLRERRMHDQDDQPPVPSASGRAPLPGSAERVTSPIEAPYQPVPPTLDARTNGLAVASLVLGLVWFFWIGSVLAVIFGHVALGQIGASSGWQRGRGWAIAGLLVGYLALALLGISIVLAAVNR